MRVKVVGFEGVDSPACEFGHKGVVFGVRGLRFGVWGAGCQGLRCRVWGVGVGV